MKFETYNYQCSPAKWDGPLFTKEQEEFRNEALDAMKEHLGIIDSLFTQDKVEYPQGYNMPLPFKEGDTLCLLRTNTRKRKLDSGVEEKEITRPYLIAKLLYASNSFYVLTLQNMTKIKREVDWKKTILLNMPSCICIIANTEGRQLLMVESNKAFSSTKMVAKIFEDTLKALLAREKLYITFRAHYCTYQFWEHIEMKKSKGVGLKSVKFHFDYPNMAEDARLLAGYFEDFGVEMNAEMDYTLKGQHGQPLNIDPKNRSRHMDSIVEYAGKTGNKLQSCYFDNTRQSYDANHVGISSLELEERVRKRIDATVKEAIAERMSQTIMPLNDDNGQLRDDLARWLNALDKNQRTGTEG